LTTRTAASSTTLVLLETGATFKEEKISSKTRWKKETSRFPNE
jgi:hypothetical protein